MCLFSGFKKIFHPPGKKIGKMSLKFSEIWKYRSGLFELFGLGSLLKGRSAPFWLSWVGSGSEISCWGGLPVFHVFGGLKGFLSVLICLWRIGGLLGEFQLLLLLFLRLLSPRFLHASALCLLFPLPFPYRARRRGLRLVEPFVCCAPT